MKRLVLLFTLVVCSITVFAQAEDNSESSVEETQVEEDGSEEGSDFVEDYDGGEEEGYTESLRHSSVDPEKVSETKGYDKESIEVRRFDQKKWEQVVRGQDYSEAKRKRKKSSTDESGTDGENGDTRINRDDDEDDEDELSGFSFSSPINSPLLTIVFYVFVGGVICYILYLIIRNTSVKPRLKKSNADAQDASGVVEDIKELEIDRLLREALSSGNYKLAVRIYFLGLLKKLDEGGIIHWKKDKTNRDYLSEIFKKSFHFEDIQQLTRVYEEVWYGEHTFPTETYHEIISSFKVVDQKINLSSPGENG
jgi:hypothetical protein